MTSKRFANEYERVLARPDLPELRRTLESARRWLAKEDEVPEDLGFDQIYDTSDPELLLSYSILAMAEFDDPKLIGFLAAGPLEDIFMSSALRPDDTPGKPELIDELLLRIEVEARRTARFRWMLSGVWTDSFKSEHAERIRKAVAGANMNTDPLPPRPWA